MPGRYGPCQLVKRYLEGRYPRGQNILYKCPRLERRRIQLRRYASCRCGLRRRHLDSCWSPLKAKHRATRLRAPRPSRSTLFRSEAMRKHRFGRERETRCVEEPGLFDGAIRRGICGGHGLPRGPRGARFVYLSPLKRLELETLALVDPPLRLTPAQRLSLRWLRACAPRGATVIDCRCGSKRFPGTGIRASVPSPTRANLHLHGEPGLSDRPPNHFVRWTPEALEIFFRGQGFRRATVHLPAPSGSELTFRLRLYEGYQVTADLFGAFAARRAHARGASASSML
jgi:hypothetical protein